MIKAITTDNNTQYTISQYHFSGTNVVGINAISTRYIIKPNISPANPNGKKKIALPSVTSKITKSNPIATQNCAKYNQ